MALVGRSAAADFYDRDPSGFAARYDSVTFEAVHPLLARYLPDTGRALDVGAGSGRDARAMAARGLAVTAVEPSDGLRAIGLRNSIDVSWINDRLPFLDTLTGAVADFDFILCSAVIMLVAPDALGQSFATMRALLNGHGRLAINLRAPQPDEPGDLFFDHSDDLVLTAARSAGLICVDRGDADDAIGRGGYRWRSFVFAHERDRTG